MPIYEYECDSCHNVIEAWQNLSDSPLETCPSCSGSLRKLISMSSFHLKGGGWYADGYGSNGNGKSKATTSCPAGGASSNPAKESTCTAKAAASCTGCSTA